MAPNDRRTMPGQGERAQAVTVQEACFAALTGDFDLARAVFAQEAAAVPTPTALR